MTASSDTPARTGGRPVLVAIGAIVAWAGGIALVWLAPEHRLRPPAVVGFSYALLWAFLFILLRRPARAKLRVFFAANIGLVMALACLEAVALLGFDYRPLFGIDNHPPWAKPLNEWDAELGFRRRPGAEWRGRRAGGVPGYATDAPDIHTYDFDRRWDAKGYRNARAYDRAGVAVIGDSMVENVHMESEDLVSTQLARDLGCDVVNLGIGGYGPAEELVVLRRHALPLEPRVVVWVFFEGNDLKNVARHLEQTSDWEATKAHYDTFLARSFTRNLLGYLHQYMLPSPLHYSGTIPREGGGAERVYFCYPSFEFTQEAEDLLARTDAILAQARTECGAAGCRLLVAFAPIKYRVYGGITTSGPDFVGHEWKMNDLPSRLGAIVTSLGEDVGYLDLTPVFEAAARDGERPFLNDDPHWSAEGNRIAARAIAERVKPLLGGK